MSESVIQKIFQIQYDQKLCLFLHPLVKLKAQEATLTIYISYILIKSASSEIWPDSFCSSSDKICIFKSKVMFLKSIAVHDYWRCC